MRAYDKLQTLIERLGESMKHQRSGYLYGAWEVSLEGNTQIVEGTGSKSLPELDKFYVPKIPIPTTWDDYHNELVGDAEQLLLHWLRSDSPQP
jgi:hypothetical protein